MGVPVVEGRQDGIDGFFGRYPGKCDHRLEADLWTIVGERAAEPLARAQVADFSDRRDRHLAYVSVVVVDGDEQRAQRLYPFDVGEGDGRGRTHFGSLVAQRLLE